MRQLILVLSILSCKIAFGQVIVADSSEVKQQFCQHVGVLKLPPNANLLDEKNKGKFDFHNVETHNLGLSQDTFLLQLALTGQTPQDKEYILELLQPGMDYISFYRKVKNKWEPTIIKDSYKISQREVKSQNPAIKILLSSNRVDTVYMAVASGEQILTPFRLGTTASIEDISHSRDMFYGLFCGIMLALIMYNFFIYIRTKDPIYGLYIIYLCMIFLAQSNVQGYTIRYFDGILAPIETYIVYVLMAFSGITGLRFISKYLEVKKYAPKARIILNATIFVYALTLPISLTNHFNIAHQILLVTGSFIGPTVLYISYHCYKRGNSGALSLLLAWSVFFIGVLIFALKDFGVLPYNDWTHNTMTIGSAIEGILLSFGLADKINTLKREKEEAQIRELETLKRSEFRLEAEVRERTHQLYEAKEKIEAQFQHLQKSQRQLVESEKMAGLGQMTAGIAHELNNPINFVSSNVAPLQKDIEEILEILNDFKNLPHEPTSPEIEAVRAKFRQYDVPMLETEIKTLLSGIREGSSRASDIVSGLRIFARTDQEVFVDANINDCVEATLMLIKSTWKNEVNLNRVTDTDLPNIDCLPGKLNQVIVNLITNAVQATIDQHPNRQHRLVEVRTWHDDQQIYLSVSDNGPGIPEALQSKIFEPFFTTKKVGQGTGLGLSISKSIVEDHQGTLSITSTNGAGCAFVIALPIRKATRLRAA